MAHGLGSPPSDRFERWFWKLSIITACCSFVLSYVAFCLPPEAPRSFVDFLDRLYWSAHLLLLHMPQNDLRGAECWPLGLLYTARCLAVVAWASTGVAVVARLLGRRIKLWRTARRGNHTVICGFGRLGLPLAHEERAARRKVVVIADGKDELVASNAIDTGASLIAGSPADSKLLRRAGFHKAKYLFAVADDDTLNIAVGLRVIELTNQMRAPVPEQMLQVFVHVADPQLRRELHNRRVFL